MMIEDRCDLIHAHWTYEFALAALASRLPTVVTVHDLPWNVLRFFRDRYRFARLLMAYQVAARGRWFSSVSTDGAAHFRRYFAPWRQVALIPNGLPDAVFEIPDQHSAQTREDIAFGTVLQGWSARKNASAALKAFGEVRLERPAATLTMYGTDYQPGGPAEQWAAEHGLADGVIFVGKLPYCDLLPRVSREIDVLVHPSLDESFSMAALEAMALRKPVIAGRNTPGVREVLAYGQAGVLLDMTDPSVISGAMQALAENPARIEQLARRGRERACNIYRTQIVFDQYEDLYRRALGEATRG